MPERATFSSSGEIPAKIVLIDGHRLKMSRVAASRIPTQMIQEKPSRDRADKQLVSSPVRTYTGFPATFGDADHAVALLRRGGCPFPARSQLRMTDGDGAVLVNLRPESLLEGEGLLLGAGSASFDFRKVVRSPAGFTATFVIAVTGVAMLESVHGISI